MARTVLITGGNSGDRQRLMERAAECIARSVGPIAALSDIHETPAWGFEAPDFLNQVLVVDTELSPADLLSATQAIERELGRMKGAPVYDGSGRRIYSSRTMDIDILFYDDLELRTPELTIPHPHIAERDFVLRPLAEVAGMLGDKITEAYKKTLSL